MMPLPFDQVRDRLLSAQRILNPRIQEPITCRRALFTLSRQVASVGYSDDDEAYVLEFFGLYWTLDGSEPVGFFETEEQATQYLMGGIDSSL